MLRRPIPLALLALGLLAAIGGAWFWAAARLDAGWARWVAERRAEGWQIEHGPPERGPPGAAVTLRVPELRIAAPAGAIPGGLGYRAEALRLALSWREPGHLAMLPQGAQSLTLAGQALPLAAERLGMRLALADGTTRLEGQTLRIGAAEPLAIGSLGVTLRRGAADFSAERLMHPALRVIGAPVDALSGELGVAPAALDIRRTELRWGRVRAELSGRLAPDAERQPAGRMTLRLRGAEAGLDALASAGLLPGAAAPAARALLRFSARDPGDGGGPLVELPAELRDRNLTIARIPVTRLPPLDWR
jgi:hypothetical protein